MVGMLLVKFAAEAVSQHVACKLYHDIHIVFSTCVVIFFVFLDFVLSD